MGMSMGGAVLHLLMAANVGRAQGGGDTDHCYLPNTKLYSLLFIITFTFTHNINQFTLLHMNVSQEYGYSAVYHVTRDRVWMGLPAHKGWYIPLR